MPLQVEGTRIQVLGPVASSNMLGSGRRVRELSDIAPQYVAKSGLCNPSDLESSRGGSIRIQHVTGLSSVAAEEKSRFPKLDECAHFHYEHVEIGPLQVSLVDDDDLKPLASETETEKWWSLSVTSQSKTWLIRRSYDNFRMLDQQLHRCIYDRKFSELTELPAECIEEQENIHKLLSDYVARFSALAGSLINCGPVLNWLELDNRGHRLLVPDTDNCPINTPAVAAAYSVKRYTAQAPDEISFEVGDMISVIDMPPPEESIWWRGKRGFQVGFFPCECVAVIGDKVPRNLQLSPQPTKPVLRKHGKLIAFFRSFILSRPSRRKLKQSGILKERVFGCDLGEHLLNSGHEIPMVLKCCVEFIETHGLVDGIYRLSGVTSNIQKLRNAFDEDRVPALYEDEAILQDVHSVASLLKMYFRELPNPLCTYQLYHQFVGVQATQGDDTRLLKMRDVVRKLPPPHYRTLEYLMKHLARVSEKGHETGMTSRNIAIVWAPNLLRCKELEVGSVAALQGVGVQAVVTEFLICYADLIFCDRLPNFSLPPQQASSKKCRPKSLAISTPTKLLSLEEARTRALLQAAGKADQDYIEVGGGPANLPAKYHTVIELPGHSRKRLGSKRSPIGWKMLFGKSGRSSQSRKEADSKAFTSSDLGLRTGKAVTELDLTQSRRRLRPAKSVESLNSSRNSGTLDMTEPLQVSGLEDSLSPMLLRNGDGKGNGHNRSVSHESYFDQLQDQKEDAALDISEIQVNFDLEESEMRIFSEDETLMSAGSGSLASNNSPRMLSGPKSGKYLVNKRLSYPKSESREDRFSCSQSADPSPKKLKTNDGIPPISKLEEQLSSSVGDIQFIDSVSPDQVLVEAEVHPIQSPSPVSSISQMSSSLLAPSSPILPHIPHLRRPLSQPMVTQTSVDSNVTNHSSANKSNNSTESFSTNLRSRPFSTVSNEMSPHSYLTSPSLAEATISDNESFSLQSSELTTPDTPVTPVTPLCRSYTPLVDFEESSLSNMTTPDTDLNVNARKSSSETDNLDEKMTKVNLEFDAGGNIGKEFAKLEEKIISNDSRVKRDFEIVTPDMIKAEKSKSELEIRLPPKPEERKPKPVHPYVNVPFVRAEAEPKKILETSFDFQEDPEKDRNSATSINYERISTESSSDSLVAANKNEETPFLWEFKSISENRSPVVEPERRYDFFSENSSKSRTTSDLESDETASAKSEMDLVKECASWLESKSLEKKGLDEKSSVEYPWNPCREESDGWAESRECFETKQLEDVEVDERSQSVEESTIGRESVGDNPSLEEFVSDKNESEETETEKVDEETIYESVTKAPSEAGEELVLAMSADPPERRVLETNLDDLLELEMDSRIVEAAAREKPKPKKRTSPRKSSSSGNVRQLLSKFETSPTTEMDITDLKLDFHERRKATSKDSSSERMTARRKSEERPKTLERLSTRRKTDKESSEPPEIQLEKSKSGSQIDERTSESGKLDILLNCEFDLSDPQRRERIEKYKEKRRNYLREKYRSESFKNEKDEFVVKIKQRHAHKSEGEEVKKSAGAYMSGPPSPEKRNPPFEKPARKSVSPKLMESPTRDSCRKSFSPEVPARSRYDSPTISSSLRDQTTRKSSFLRLSGERRSANDFRSTKSSPEKKSHLSLDFSTTGVSRSDGPSPEFPPAFYSRRRMTDPARSSHGKPEPCDLLRPNKSSSNVSGSDKMESDAPATSPTFCIKDMAALFEKRGDPKTHKQYLSSV